METYCVICKRNTANENSGARRTTQNRLMVQSNCSICSTKNQGLFRIKKQSDVDQIMDPTCIN